MNFQKGDIDAKQVRPNHYKLLSGREVKDVMQEVMTAERYKGFLVGNILKYVLRYEQKNGKEDLVKAKTYIEFLLEVK